MVIYICLRTYKTKQMQHSDSIIGLTFNIASVGLDLNTKISNLIDYRNSVLTNLIEENSRPKPDAQLLNIYNKEVSATEYILQSLVK